MPIKIKCTKCLTLIAAADSTAGQRVKCPKCATPLLIPAATNSPAAAPKLPANARPSQPAPIAGKKPAPAAPAAPGTNNDFGLGAPGAGDLDLPLDLAALPDPAALGLAQQPTVAWSPPKKSTGKPTWLIVAGGGVGVLILLVVGQLVISAISIAMRSTPEQQGEEVAANLPAPEIAAPPAPKSAPLVVSQPLVPPPSTDPLNGGIPGGSQATKNDYGPPLSPAESKLRYEAQILETARNGICLVSALDATGHEIAFSTGFLVSETGLLITDYQAIKYARSARARFRDGTILPVLGYRGHDIDRNLVLLELAGLPKKFSALRLQGVGSPIAGAEVVTIGYSKTFDYISSKGTVRAVGKTDELPSELQEAIQAPPDNVWVQTDVVTAQGASGFPLLNKQGEVIGLSSWTADNKTPGLAVHARHIQALVNATSQGTVGLAEMNMVLGPKGWFQPKDPKILLAATQIRTLSEVYPNSDEELRKLIAEFKEVLTQLAADYQNNPALAGLFLDLLDINLTFISQGGEYPNWLRQIIRKTKEPQVACSASIALTYIFGSNQAANASFEPEILAVLENVMTKYPDVPLAQITYGELASMLSFEIQSLALGKPAPDIVGPDSDGKELRLSDLRGKIVLLHFFADWTQADVQMTEEVHAMVVKYKDLPVVVLGVNADAKERFPQVAHNVNLNYRCWIDGSHGPIANRWNISSFPYTYILDKQGIVRYKYAGNSRAYVAPSVDELLSGRKSTLAGQTPKVDLDAEIENLNTQIAKKPIEEVVEAALAQVQSQRESVTKKQLAAIEAWIKQGLEADPNSYALQVAKAELLLIRDEVPAAVKQLREIVARKDLDTKHIAIFKNQLALVLVTQSDDASKNSAEAFDLIQDAITRGGEQPALIHTRGMVYLALKLVREARTDLTSALVNNPDPMAYFHLAQIEMAARNKPAARDALHKALFNGLKNMPLSSYEQKQLRLLAKTTGTFLGNR